MLAGTGTDPGAVWMGRSEGGSHLFGQGGGMRTSVC